MAAKLIGRLGGSARIDAPLRGVTRVGAAADNDVCIGSSGVAGYHARVVADDGGFSVERADQAAVFLNGDRVTRARLRHLDVVTLAAGVDLVFLSTGADDDVPVPGTDVAVTIEWLDGPDKGRRIEVRRGETLIGRAISCAIVADTPSVSRAHARISHLGDAVRIEDLGSANGTLMDGARIDRPTALRSGAVVTVGLRRFRVDIDGAAPETIVIPEIKERDVPPAPVIDQEWRTRLDWSAEIGGAPALPIPVVPPVAVVPSATVVRAMPVVPVVPVVPELPADDIPTRFMKVGAVVAPDFDQREQADEPKTQLFRGPLAPPPALDAPAPPRPVGIIGVRLWDDSGAREIGLGRASVGRSPDALVRIDKPHVSREHAVLVVTPDQVTVIDAGKDNGTDVNGERVTGSQLVKAGDVVAFAGEKFRIEILRAKGGE
jgi:pSer/pThr/pTyr-binding forkhead associated (FHA) protein